MQLITSLTEYPVFTFSPRLLRPVVLFLCRTVFFAGGFYWVTMKGKQASSKEAPILLVAPHSSFFDALPVVFLGLTSVVAKASTHQIMLFGSKLLSSVLTLVFFSLYEYMCSVVFSGKF